MANTDNAAGNPKFCSDACHGLHPMETTRIRAVSMSCLEQLARSRFAPVSTGPNFRKEAEVRSDAPLLHPVDSCKTLGHVVQSRQTSCLCRGGTDCGHQVGENGVCSNRETQTDLLVWRRSVGTLQRVVGLWRFTASFHDKKLHVQATKGQGREKRQKPQG